MDFVNSVLGRQKTIYKPVPKDGEDTSTQRAFLCPARLTKYAGAALLPAMLAFYIEIPPPARVFIHVLLIVTTFTIVLATLYNLQDRLLYHPDMPPTSNLYVPFPSHVQYEVVNLTTSDNVNLHGFFLKHTSHGDVTVPTVVFFHGNAGNAGSPCALPLHLLCRVNVLVVDYRGYGRSTGCPSESGLYIDGRTCIEYAMSREDVDPNKIVLFGHSMGGAVAIDLASRIHNSSYRIAALIAENTFTSIPDAARHIFKGIFPMISKLPTACYKNKFLSVNKIGSVSVPILFICGEKDEILNPDMTRKLQSAANNPHTVLLRVPNGSHNDTWCCSQDYHRCISAFLKKVFNEDLQTEQAVHQNEANPTMTVMWKCEVVSS